MANVLPTDMQKKVWALNRSRLILVTGLVLLGLAGAAALTLMPSYAALRIAAPIESSTRSDAEAERADAISLERSQMLIRELGPLLITTTSPSTAATRALAARPTGVRITRVMYTKTDEEGRLTLIGSGNRDQVSAYKDALASSGEYASVSVPVGALVGSEGGGFSIVVTGSF